MNDRTDQVELDAEEARSLYQQLDSDRDGALGAEDLLIGAPVIGGHFINLFGQPQGTLSCLLRDPE